MASMGQHVCMPIKSKQFLANGGESERIAVASFLEKNIEKEVEFPTSFFYRLDKLIKLNKMT